MENKKDNSTNVMSWNKELIIGFCIGLANIIPGVSGGTFLLIFGIYERVINILNKLGVTVVKEGAGHLISLLKDSDKKKSWENILLYVKEYDLSFLVRIIAGAGIAIVVLSSVMKMLLLNHFSVTYALFFGLILVSIIIPIKLFTEKKIHLIFFFLLGTVLTVYISTAVNPYDKAKGKSDIYKERLIYSEKSGVKEGKNDDKKKFAYTGQYTPRELGYSALCGATAVSAMVLPGISGSLVMILMGEYFEIISAISGMKTLALDYFVFLGCFALGMVFGLLLFARFVDFVFKRYYNKTMSFLIGLMAGSLYTLWPFKKYVIMDQYVKGGGVITVVKDAVIYTNINVVPENPSHLIAVIVSAVAGGVIMLFFVTKEIKK